MKVSDRTIEELCSEYCTFNSILDFPKSVKTLKHRLKDVTDIIFQFYSRFS